VPVHSVVLIPTRDEALNFPAAPLRLASCSDCGFITNTAFDASLQDYSGRYEETQGFSETFGAFHRRLAADLIERYDLRGRTVVEIGCGKGEFLSLLCELGDNQGIGFDPAYVSARNTSPARDRMLVIEDFYSERYAHHRGDFYCCKMTLEHIHDTAEFIATLRRAIGDRPDAVVFFQVPEATRVFRDLAFWDIYYEHCSYFDSHSLRRLFAGNGFDVLGTWTDYDDQYLMIEARPTSGEGGRTEAEGGSDLRHAADHFAGRIDERLESWKGLIGEFARMGRRVVLWGGGSKAVAFLTTLDVREAIPYAVDINPYKSGTFLAGTGQEVVAPSFLTGYRPDVVIIMNPIYRSEIQQQLTMMGLTPMLVNVDADPGALSI
jgi:SAM-dependent methyltransferase